MRGKWLAVAVIALSAMVGAARIQAAEKKPAVVPQDKIDKVTAAMPDKPFVKPAKAYKVLTLTTTKGFFHGSIPLAAKAIEIMGQKTGAFEATTTDDVTMLAADKLKAFDAIFWDQCTGEVFNEEALKASLLDFVKSGKGIVGAHAATDCFYKWKEFGEMMGGYFAGHPFRRISVKLDDPSNPLMTMFDGKGFEISDEIYTFRDPYSREKLRILMSIDWDKTKPYLQGDVDKRKKDLEKSSEKTKPESPEELKKKQDEQKKKAKDLDEYFDKLPRAKDNDYALSWIRDYGKGRVFYCGFGHDDQIWWNPTILKHYLAGFQYALGDLKADATPTAKLTPAPKAAPGPDLEAKKAAAPRQSVTVYAADAAPAAKPDAQGWICLFDGKDLGQWQNAGGQEPGKGWVIQDGALVRSTASGDIWSKQRFGDFTLDLEFKTEGNSGIFIRTDNPKDCVQTGIEIQVDKGGGKEKLGRNDVGSVYDCLAPSKNPFKDGEWNHVVITAKDSKITIVANDVPIVDMDLNQWTDAHQNPDGSKNKFNKALKDFKREGHVGLQDHGAKVSYRNIKVKPLTAAAASTGAAPARRG